MGEMSDRPILVTSDQKIQSDYYMWLCDLVQINEPDHSYFILAKELYKKHFYSIIPNDDNRELDGKRLRQDFFEESGYINNGALDGPCSMLEFLIGLAIRMEKELFELDKENTCLTYFWLFIQNLGLDILDDEHYIDRYGDIIFEKTMNTFLNREYHRNGSGGLFPLKKSNKDQRKVEIWYQMQEYLDENYKI